MFDYLDGGTAVEIHVPIGHLVPMKAALYFVSALILVALPLRAVNPHDADAAGPMGGVESLLSRTGPAYGEARFMVVSDPHIISPALWSEGAAFETLLSNTDGKLVREAAVVLQALRRAVRRERPDFLLVAGDLTFNGARASHEFLASALARVEEAGVAVYVVPGNHDIANPWARQYTGAEARRVSHVGPAEFRDIYAEFGYADAAATDTGSLAYVTEAAPGLSVVMIDSNRYERNLERGYPESRGAISESQARWLEKELVAARRAGDAVLPVMHHSLLSHRSGGGGRPFGSSWIDMWPRFARLFWDEGAPVVFSGHAHEQDIAGLRGENGEWLYDVATGSLASYPHPYRMVTITAEQRLEVRSAAFGAGDFAASADDTSRGDAFLARSRRRYIARFVERVSPRLREREDLRAEVARDRARDIAISLLDGSYREDPPPGANSISVDLLTGRWTTSECHGRGAVACP